MVLNWSDEYQFRKKNINQHAPAAAGVYEILQSIEYLRYKGPTRTLKVGMSKSNLCQELLNHIVRHTSANRLSRIRRRGGALVTFRYATLSPGDTIAAEKRLLCDFEDRHWDLPVLNRQRGYQREEDSHYRDGIDTTRS